jgi:hypothetical protein
MFTNRIFLCFLVLVIALAGFPLSNSIAYAKESTAPDEIVALASGCTASLWAPWKAGNQVSARVRINCPTVKPKIVAGVGLDRNSWSNDSWNGPWKNNTCNNTNTCTVTISLACRTGNWWSTGNGQVGSEYINPSPYISSPTYISCN